MDPSALIPMAEPIPAPSWLFVILDVFTFLLHLLMMNILLGGSLIVLFSGFRKQDEKMENSLHGSLVGKLPTSFALTVNLGIAPLLFLQVIYGHLFYSSSVLMAVYWIIIIPLLIIAYYGAYVHTRKYSSAFVSKTAIIITSVILLYIAFMFVNNMTLMLQPEKWNAYFSNRGGTILNWGDPTFIPRYLHFVVGAVAVAGLAMSLIWWLRQRRGVADAEEKIKSGLKIFAVATALQLIIGFWFLLAIPSEFILQFMGQNLLYTIVLFAGMVLGIGAMILAFMNRFMPALIHLIATIVLMVITRVHLRSLYLDDVFQLSSLEISPQYGVMALFFLIFVIGLAVVGYMIKIAVSAKERRVTS